MQILQLLNCISLAILIAPYIHSPIDTYRLHNCADVLAIEQHIVNMNGTIAHASTASFCGSVGAAFLPHNPRSGSWCWCLVQALGTTP